MFGSPLPSSHGEMPDTPRDVTEECSVACNAAYMTKILRKVMLRKAEKDIKKCLEEMLDHAEVVGDDDRSIGMRRKSLKALNDFKAQHFPKEPWSTKNENEDFVYFSNLVKSSETALSTIEGIQERGNISLEVFAPSTLEESTLEQASNVAAFFPLPQDDGDRDWEDPFADCVDVVQDAYTNKSRTKKSSDNDKDGQAFATSESSSKYGPLRSSSSVARTRPHPFNGVSYSRPPSATKPKSSRPTIEEVNGVVMKCRREYVKRPLVVTQDYIIEKSLEVVRARAGNETVTLDAYKKLGWKAVMEELNLESIKCNPYCIHSRGGVRCATSLRHLSL